MAGVSLDGKGAERTKGGKIVNGESVDGPECLPKHPVPQRPDQPATDPFPSLRRPSPNCILTFIGWRVSALRQEIVPTHFREEPIFPSSEVSS